MAAITGAVVAAAGIGLSVAAAVKQDKLKKSADRAATAAANQLKNLKAENPYDAVGVPTMGTKLAQEGIDRSAMAVLGGLQGAGAEGVLGGVPALTANVNEAELGLAAQQNDLQFQRDMQRAEAQRMIDQQNLDRKQTAYENTLQGAQIASVNAQNNKNQAITGAVTSAGNMVTALGGIEELDYKWGGKGTPDTSATTPQYNTKKSTTLNNPGLDNPFIKK